MSETTSATIFVRLNSGLDRYVLQLFLVTDILLDFECIKKWIYFFIDSNNIIHCIKYAKLQCIY